MLIRSGWRMYEEDTLMRVAMVTNRLLSHLPMFKAAKQDIKFKLNNNSLLYVTHLRLTSF